MEYRTQADMRSTQEKSRGQVGGGLDYGYIRSRLAQSDRKVKSD